MLKVGIIGLGTMGLSHAQVYDKIPFIQVKGVCDTNREVLERVTKTYVCDGYQDYRELLSDPEIQAVSICMPDNLHVDVVLEAVKREKHILLEKPIADSMKSGLKIYHAVKNYDKVFTVGYNMRYDSRYYHAKSKVEQGEIGDIVHISCRRNSGIGGPLRFVGQTDLYMHVMVHDVNMVNWIMGCRPVKVFAKSRNLVLEKHNMTDTVLAIITYEDGTIVSMEACWVMNKNWPSAVDDTMEIVGTKGVIYTDGCNQGFRLMTEEKISFPDTRYRPQLHGNYGGDLCEELMGFLNSVIHGTKPMSTAEEAILDISVVDAICRSVTSGKEETIVWE